MGERDSSDPLLIKPRCPGLLILHYILVTVHSKSYFSLPLDQVDMVQKLPVEESLLLQLVRSLRRTASHHDHDPRGDQPCINQQVKHLPQTQLSSHGQV